MSQVFTATFQDGVLKPEQPLDLPPGTRVRVTVETFAIDERDKALQELDRLCEEFPIHSGEERLTRDQLHERR
jgi:predicted DNA-binding antitoxin AbrB/MazE fold protein